MKFRFRADSAFQGVIPIRARNENERLAFSGAKTLQKYVDFLDDWVLEIVEAEAVIGVNDGLDSRRPSGQAPQNAGFRAVSVNDVRLFFPKKIPQGKKSD